MTRLEQNKVYKTLKYKRLTGKTSTGLKLGWLLDCSEADIFNIANYVSSHQSLVPRWSCGAGGICLRREIL